MERTPAPGDYVLTDEERDELRAQGYHPVEMWVPDLDDPAAASRWREGARAAAEADAREGMDDVLSGMLDEFADE